MLRLLRKFMPVTNDFSGGKFFLIRDARRFATPLAAVVLALGTTDVFFAVDSIPAVLAVTTDPFIVYTSNVFAILGLRALFFAISGLMKIFHYIQYGLVVILSFVGIKMLISDFFPIPVSISLALIVGVLALSILASLLWPSKDGPIIEKDNPA
jgi:tellurite resistance protein TerC